MATIDENRDRTAAPDVDAGAEVDGPEPHDGGLDDGKKAPAGDPGAESLENLDFIMDIPLQVSVELGRTKMLVNELLRLGQGSVIELTKMAGESLEILVNQKPIARGEVVVVNDKYGIRLTEVISPMERIERLR